jgi:hypothetical protein
MNYVTFALRFGVAHTDAYVLPALFDGAARKIGKSASWLLAEVALNDKLGRYLADCAAKVAAADRADA